MDTTPPVFNGPPEEAISLDSRACLARLAELTAFENKYFGECFAWSLEQTTRWAMSQATVHAAMTLGGSIVASMSVFLVHSDSCKLLVSGKIRETELQPWLEGPSLTPPIVYFASVIASSKSYLPVLYNSLGRDTANLLQSYGIAAQEGLAIAACQAGRKHLERNGFRRAGDALYQNTHAIMRIRAHHAQTAFWRQVLAQNSTPTAQPFASYLFATRSPFSV